MGQEGHTGRAPGRKELNHHILVLVDKPARAFGENNETLGPTIKWSPLKLLPSGDCVNGGSLVPVAVKLILTLGTLLDLTIVNVIIRNFVVIPVCRLAWLQNCE